MAESALYPPLLLSVVIGLGTVSTGFLILRRRGASYAHAFVIAVGVSAFGVVVTGLGPLLQAFSIYVLDIQAFRYFSPKELLDSTGYNVLEALLWGLIPGFIIAMCVSWYPRFQDKLLIGSLAGAVSFMGLDSWGLAIYPPDGPDVVLFLIVFNLIGACLASAVISGIALSLEGRLLRCQKESRMALIGPSVLTVFFLMLMAWCLFGLRPSQNFWVRGTPSIVRLFLMPGSDSSVTLHELSTANATFYGEVSLSEVAYEGFLRPLGTIGSWQLESPESSLGKGARSPAKVSFCTGDATSGGLKFHSGQAQGASGMSLTINLDGVTMFTLWKREAGLWRLSGDQLLDAIRIRGDAVLAEVDAGRIDGKEPLKIEATQLSTMEDTESDCVDLKGRRGVVELAGLVDVTGGIRSVAVPSLQLASGYPLPEHTLLLALDFFDGQGSLKIGVRETLIRNGDRLNIMSLEVEDWRETEGDIYIQGEANLLEVNGFELIDPVWSHLPPGIQTTLIASALTALGALGALLVRSRKT